jgi:hypothetical protein
MIRRLLRRLFPGDASGGEVHAYRPTEGEQLAILSPGRRVDDPDEAEVLGMTASVRRLRRR